MLNVCVHCDAKSAIYSPSYPRRCLYIIYFVLIADNLSYAFIAFRTGTCLLPSSSRRRKFAKMADLNPLPVLQDDLLKGELAAINLVGVAGLG